MPAPPALRLLGHWSARDLLRQRLIAVASVIAVALGVAVFVAIRLANQSATASFEAALERVSGRSDLEVSAASASLPDSCWPELRDSQGIAAATPTLSGLVTVATGDRLTARLTGIDPFTVGPFLADDLDLAIDGAGLAWLGWPASVWIDSRFAAQLGVGAGNRLELEIDGVQREVEVAALVESEDSAAPANRLWCDIGWAQEILDRVGELDSVQLRAEDPDELEALAARLEDSANFPAGASVAPPAQRSGGLRALFAGYRLNLTALALVSLLVGAFLIYGTMAATVARRGREIAVLRALGTSRTTLILLVLGQALVLGAIGTTLGLPLGILAGERVLELIRVGQLNRLVAEASAVYRVQPGELLAAAGVGLTTAVAGAVLPAIESLRHQPVHALHPHRAHAIRPLPERPLAKAGGVALLLAVICGWGALLTPWPWLSFVACLLLVAAVTCLIPAGGRLLSLGLAPLTRFFTLADLARRNFLRAQPRAMLTMAGLITALAMVGGVEIMIHSFRSSVDAWISTNLQADFFVTRATGTGSEPPPLPDSLAEHARALAGVAVVETLAQQRVETSNGARYLLNAVDSPGRRHEFALIDGDEAGLDSFWRGEGLLASEAFARAEKLDPGDPVVLESAAGPVELPLLGVIIDYSDDSGRLYLTREAFAARWPDPGTRSLALYLEEDITRDSVRRQLESRVTSAGAELWDRRQLREEVLDVFDSTFRITYALRAISILVAVIGTFALVSIQLRERAAEIAGLRSQGASVAQIFRLHLWEGGMLGLVTGILGTLCGIGLAALLTWVVMKAFFHWTVQFSVPPTALLALPLGMLLAVLLAVIEPSWRSARAPLIDALREE